MLQSEADRSILKRYKSPREAFDHREKWHDPESEVATQKLYDKLHNFTIPPNSNPIEALHALEDTNNQMAEEWMGIPDTFLHARFVRALPDEYGHVKATLQAMKNHDRAEVVRVVGMRHSTLPQEMGSQRSSQPPEQAILFEQKRRPEWCAKRSWPRSQGHPGPRRGGNSSKGGGSSCGGGPSCASRASGSSHGGGSRLPGHCW